ncbi:flagellar biosynthesis protein FlhF [Nitrosovibrio tenuis]|uniref:Flagellar biosynthesis protein FlhF n=1 Tax=Nitrosovibrio tenuis TaxID=1233 RepID=A0A1H7J7Z0_9PROT|nr:flagellar biosynthesis protein FlhF [Nitrosovibrio tenuis]SEK70829.1 flagellar biosynthesis protein FlhF [Nitrosovibrio tenuis]
MSIKRFFAKTTSEALRKVRDALGPEGVILSNRPLEGGIEILALRQDDITALIPVQTAEEPDAENSEGVHVSLSRRAVSDKEVGANASKPVFEAQDPSLAGRKDILNRIREAGITGKGWGRDVLSLQTEAQERGVNRESGLSWTSGVAVRDVVKKREEISQIQVGQVTKPVTKKRRSVGRSPGGAKAEGPIANRLASDEALEAAIPVKRQRNSRRAAAEIAPDVKTDGKRKSRQISAIDTRQLADEVAASVLREINSMRSTLEQQFASLNWKGREHSGSTREYLLHKLLTSGFSAPLAHGLLDKLADHADIRNDQEGSMKHIRSSLTRNLKTIGDEDEILKKGGIYALVGPTGVGKTTTTAKLAARCVIRHGADKLALLTTDGYRIGGHEQLRIYGKILGVTVHAVKDAQDLALALVELRGKHMVLIDTVGVGQRDQMVAEQVAMFAGCGTKVKRLLLLNASSNLHTLDEVAEAYRGDGLTGAIITKLDEAVVSGCALDAAIRHQLPLYYVSRGQRVPEDLELADPRHLVNGALDSLTPPLHAAPEGAFPLVMTRSEGKKSHLKISGARLD